MPGDESIALVEAKREYSEQLKQFLIDPIFEGIESIYTDAKTAEPRQALRRFQQLLRDVPKWNQDIIDTEYDRICESSKCNVFDEIIKTIFIAHSKILSSIQLTNTGSDVTIEVPTSKVFIHCVYKNIAKFAFNNPHLFKDEIANSKRLKNRQTVINNIEKCIDNTIRSMVPIESILKRSNANEFRQDFTDLNLIDEIEPFQEPIPEPIPEPIVEPIPEPIPEPIEQSVEILEPSVGAIETQLAEQSIESSEIPQGDHTEFGCGEPEAPETLEESLQENIPEIVREPEAPEVPSQIQTVDEMIKYPEQERDQFMKTISNTRQSKQKPNTKRVVIQASTKGANGFSFF